MIKFLEIKNFQSHENAKMEFDSGINTIVGSTDSGKTAVVRALLWLLTNRPVGKSMVSHWNRDEKKEPREETSARLITDKGSVERKRTKNFNGYVIDDEEKLEAIKTDVPDQIGSKINVNEVNVQRQLDSPFLLSGSSGEAAKFFNSTVGLDIIDRALTYVESLRRKTKSETKRKEEELKGIEKELEKLFWIDEVEKWLGKAEKTKKRLEEKQRGLTSVSTSIKEYEHLKAEIKKYKNLEEVDKWLIELGDLLRKKEEKEKEYKKLNNTVYDCVRLQKDIMKLKNIDQMDNWVKEFETLNTEQVGKLMSRDKLKYDMKYYVEKEEDIEKCNKEIIILKNKMPDVCPLCGQEIKNKEKMNAFDSDG